MAKIEDDKTQKKAFKLVEKNPDAIPFDIQEMTGSWMKPYIGFNEKIKEAEKSGVFRKDSTAKMVLEMHYGKIKEKTRKRKIEANIIEQLVSTYESIKRSFEEDKGESSEYYVRIYGSVIEDLREIVEFESKK